MVSKDTNLVYMKSLEKEKENEETVFAYYLDVEVKNFFSHSIGENESYGTS